MSITSASMGGASSLAVNGMQQRKKPPDMTKDQLTEMQGKLKAEGKDTSNLDRMVSSFDQLDTNQDGKVGMEELKAGAADLGIEMPQRPHGKGGAESAGDPQWGPPPGLLSDGDFSLDESQSSDENSGLLRMLQRFEQSNPGASGSLTDSSVSYVA